jgi:hypothetical protein
MRSLLKQILERIAVVSCELLRGSIPLCRQLVL